MLVCFSCAMILAMPAFCAQYSLEGHDIPACVAMAFSKAIKVFGGDSIYEETINNMEVIPAGIRGYYIAFIKVLGISTKKNKIWYLLFNSILGSIDDDVAGLFNCKYVHLGVSFSVLDSELSFAAAYFQYHWAVVAEQLFMIEQA